MGHHSEAFIGIDTSKSRNAVAIAEGGRGGEARYLGEFPATEARGQACNEIPSSDVLLRGRADGIQATQTNREPRPRLHGGGSLTYPEEARRPRKDEPARWGEPRQVGARRRQTAPTKLTPGGLTDRL